MDGIIIEPTDTSEEPRCVRILAVPAGKVNLADFRNAVPVAETFSPINVTDADVKEPQLAAIAVPSFLNPKTSYIDSSGHGTDCLSQRTRPIARRCIVRVSAHGLLLSTSRMKLATSTGKVLGIL